MNAALAQAARTRFQAPRAPSPCAAACRMVAHARWLHQRGQVAQAAARLDYARSLLAHR